MSHESTLCLPQDGAKYQAFGNLLSVMLDGKQSGGTISVMLETVPAGGGPPLHLHIAEDELFLGIEGRLSYFVAGNWTELSAGGLVYLPRGAPHCFHNFGSVPGRHWIITLPSGFERFYARCAEEFARQGGPDSELIAQIHREHGILLLDQGV